MIMPRSIYANSTGTGACFIFGLVYMQVVNYPANKAKPEQTMQYDLIIIGAGSTVPAGYYARRAGLNVLMTDAQHASASGRQPSRQYAPYPSRLR